MTLVAVGSWRVNFSTLRGNQDGSGPHDSAVDGRRARRLAQNFGDLL